MGDLLRYALIFLLLSSCAWAQWTNRADSCSTADGTSLGQGWTLKHCQGVGDGNAPSNFAATANTMTLTTNPTVGSYMAWSMGLAGTWSIFMTATDSLGNVAQGKVSTSGTAVTYTTGSGLPFSQAGCLSQNGGVCDWNGKTIKINGTNYTISTVNSATSITLTATAGTQTNVAYVGPGPFCTDTDGDANNTIASVCWAYVSVGGASDTITATCHNGGNSPGCNDSSRYVFILDSAEFSNSAGIAALDLAACQYTACQVKGGHQGNGGTPPLATTGSPATAPITVTPTYINELLFMVGGYGSGPIYAPSGYTPLILGVSGANPANGGCGGTTGYCTNEQQSEAIVRTVTGAFTADEFSGMGQPQFGCPHNGTQDCYEIQGFALSPGASFSYAPNPVAFGGIYTGSSGGPTTVTITNNGGSGLVIGTLSSNNGVFTLSSDTCSNTTVAAAGTCTFAITFTPTVAGAQSATITVPDNVGNPDLISATGTGLVVSSNPIQSVSGITLWEALQIK